jgi:DNA repair protein RadC
MRTTTIRTSPTRAATSPVKTEGLTIEQRGSIGDEQAASYTAGTMQEQTDAAILERAESILRKRFERLTTIAQPSDAGAWLRMRLAMRDSEVFCVVLMDNRHRVLAFEELFQGTIDGASVHPREVVRTCLRHNAAAVIFAHNHPSGNSDPSAADVAITRTLKQALDLIGVRVLDHLVIGETVTSLSQRGLC